MWFYYLFLTFIGLCLYKYNETKSRIYSDMLIAVVTLVAVCRYEVGYDYKTYFGLITSGSHELIWLLFSPLSAIIAEIAIYFQSPQLLFIIFGIPTYILIISTLKKYSANYSLSVIMFICLCYFSTLSTIRQALAVAITFYAYQYVQERKLFKYLLLITLAYLFHPSALIAIVIYWLPIFQFNLLIVCCLVGYVCKSIIFYVMKQYGFYENYLEEDVVVEGGKYTQILVFLIYAFCLYIWLKQGKKRQYKDLINIITVGVMSYLMFGPHFGARAALYFTIYMYLLLPNLVAGLAIRSKNILIIICSYIFIVYFMSYLWVPFVKGNSSSYVPYQTFFFK